MYVYDDYGRATSISAGGVTGQRRIRSTTSAGDTVGSEFGESLVGPLPVFLHPPGVYVSIGSRLLASLALAAAGEVEVCISLDAEKVRRATSRLNEQPAFTTNNNGNSLAAAALLRGLQRRSEGLANSLGLQSFELQGGTVVNADVEAFLLRLGFERATVFDDFFGETQEIFRKVVEL